MREILVQIMGLVFLIIPIVAIQWNLAGGKRKRSLIGAFAKQPRWRLEIYSNSAGAENALVDTADIPFPVKQVRSARGELAQSGTASVWALPQMELEVDVEDPFAAEVMEGMFGVDHRVRFVTGNEAVVDTASNQRLRLRALQF